MDADMLKYFFVKQNTDKTLLCIYNYAMLPRHSWYYADKTMVALIEAIFLEAK